LSARPSSPCASSTAVWPSEDLEAIARQLLRSESVASSRIEGRALSQRRLAEAIFAPDQGDITAVSVLNNIAAMETAIRLGSEARPFDVDDILVIHRMLLNAPIDRRIASVVRTTQNWIGSRANTPLGAQFIPPPRRKSPRCWTTCAPSSTATTCPPSRRRLSRTRNSKQSTPSATGAGELQAAWRERTGRPRRDSTTNKLLALLPAYPIVNVATVQAMVGVSDEAARVALQALERAGILSQVTVGRRNRAWTAKDLFGVINAFE